MTTKDREEVISILSQENVPLHVIRALLRAGATLHRLAEAVCNGDYPADNGERKVAPCCKCEGLWVRSSMVARLGKGPRRDQGTPHGSTAEHAVCYICPDCRTEERVAALCAAHSLVPKFGGDPRGAVLIVSVPSGRTNDWGRTGIVVA